MKSTRLCGAVVVALALSGAVAVARTGPAAAEPGDYWIAAGDDTSKQLLAFDPAAANWNDDAAIKWRWQATKARGFSDAELAVSAGYSDYKLRERPGGGQSFAVANGMGLAAVVSYPGGNRQWAKVIPGNLHAAELLPDGNVALAASDGGWVRVYASSQGPNASAYAEYDLIQAHAALWDPSIRRLWVTGQDPVTKAHILTALVVGGTPAAPTLREDTGRRAVLASAWGHDVYGYAHDANLLWITGNSQAWLYDKRSKTFSSPAGGADRSFVKAIGNQPSGQIVETRPDSAKSPQGRCVANGWCTDTVDFYGPNTTRTRTGAVFYKARVWSPYYSVVDRSLHGTVWNRARGATGTWASTASEIDTNALTTEVASAVLPDGTLHVFTVVPGSGVWHRSRGTAGDWSAATRIDANGAVTDVSAAVLPDGTLHVQTLLPGSGAWDRVRGADGSWPASAKIDTNGALTDIAAAALPNGTLNVMMLLPGSGIWHRVRGTGGTWADAVKVDDNRDVTGVSATALPNGSLHLNTIVPGSGVWHRVRSAAGTWSGSQAVDGNGSVLSIATAGLPDGTLQLATVPDIS
jgi:hypothetical protein